MTALRKPQLSRYARASVVTLALGIAVCVTLAGLIIASLLGQFIDMRRDLAETQRHIERARRPEAAAATAPGAAATDMQAGRLLKGVDPADIQSQFQTLVKDAAGRHGFTFDSLQVLKTERAAGLNRVSLRLDGQIPQASLGAFLVDLATGNPVIVLQGLELRPQIIQSNRLGASAVPGDVIAARIELAAFSSAPAKAERKGGTP